MTGSLLIHAKVLSKRANKMLICLAIVMLSANFSGCALSNDLDMPSSNFDEVITVPDPDSKTNELGHINVSTDSDDISKHNDSAIVQAKQTNPTKEKKAVSITISATGELHNCVSMKPCHIRIPLMSFMIKKGNHIFFRNVYDILSSDDFTIVNLEGPLTKSRDKQNKLYNHKGKPEYIDILTAGSIEAVSFSNNHSYDYGQSGYEETLSLLEKSGIVYASG
ncbi:MAG: CapA family protein [Caldicoprobacterales bacterium]